MPLRVHFGIVPRGALYLLTTRVRECSSGIFLSHENSMVPTDKIYTIRDLRRYSIDIDDRAGAPELLECLESLESLSKRNRVTVIPGTLIEDRGDYFHVSMPIIAHGRVLSVRRKMMNPSLLIDRDRVLSKYQECSSPFFQREPYSNTLEKRNIIGPEEIYESIKNQHFRETIESLKPTRIDGQRILGVICNEFSLVPRYYNEKPASVIAHSCDTFFHDEEERLMKYGREAARFIDTGVTEEEFYILFCQIGSLTGMGRCETGAGVYRVTRNEVKKCSSLP